MRRRALRLPSEDEEYLALQHAYSAIERYPMMALNVLPRELIPESVRSLIPVVASWGSNLGDEDVVSFGPAT
jgi:hypothetical protein